MFFLLFGRGRVIFFAVWAGPGPPPKQQKKERAPAQTAKKNTRKAQTTKKTRQQKNKHSYRGLGMGFGFVDWIWESRMKQVGRGGVSASASTHQDYLIYSLDSFKGLYRG